LMLKNEDVPSGEDYTIFDSENPWKQITLKDYYTKDIMQTIFSNGELLYTSPTIKKIAEYAKESKGRFWDQYLRIHNPAIYKVDLSSKLYDIRKELLHIKYK